MTTVRDRILEYLASHPEGVDDDELARALGFSRRQQANNYCRQLWDEGRVERRKVGGKLRTYLSTAHKGLNTHRRPFASTRQPQNPPLPKGEATSSFLSELGFRPAGNCSLDPSLKSGVRFHIHHLADERVIYACVVDGRVRYIGVCDSTKTTLRDRMGRYQSKVGAGTNKRITEIIQVCLSQGEKVEIFALKPEASLSFRELKVDLIKGLENPLLQAMQPEWNIQS